MEFDWEEIEADFRKQVQDLPGLELDRERIESWTQDIAAGRLSFASNQVRGEMRLADAAAVSPLDAIAPDERSRLTELGSAAISAGKVACAALNGGMATRFGGDVKGIVEALGGRSFLEIKLAQAQARGRVPFLIMNSFATHRRTLEFLEERGLGDDVHPFVQDVALRLTPDGEVFRGDDSHVSLYAPGHGDFPGAMNRSGLLGQLRSRGVELVTLSNIDNLGAELDPLVIGSHLDSGLQLTAEVAPTEPGDVGGAPAYVDGVLQVVEGFRYPDGFDATGQPYLSANTFTIALDLLEANHPLTWFYVEKSVDGRKAVQMERLVNELSAHVETLFLGISRDGAEGRFFPIKSREDLDALRSDPALVARFSSAASRGL
ncbi:MAG: hypothetical protein GY725_05200 [bacterium]|nr:hypothetical protein [bacterium]